MAPKKATTICQTSDVDLPPCFNEDMVPSHGSAVIWVNSPIIYSTEEAILSISVPVSSPASPVIGALPDGVYLFTLLHGHLHSLDLPLVPVS